MSDSFANTNIECPFCKKQMWFLGKMHKPQLECIERNYSGCSVDIANCPECGRGYQVSYKIDEVVRLKDWDGESRKQREVRKVKKLAKIKGTLNQLGVDWP